MTLFKNNMKDMGNLKVEIKKRQKEYEGSKTKMYIKMPREKY